MGENCTKICVKKIGIFFCKNLGENCVKICVKNCIKNLQKVVKEILDKSWYLQKIGDATLTEIFQLKSDLLWLLIIVEKIVEKFAEKIVKKCGKNCWKN